MPTSTLPPPKRRNRRQLPFVALLTFLLLLLLLFSSKIQKICDDIKIIGRSSSNELNHQRRLRGRTIPTSMTAQSEEAQTVTYLPPPVQGNADYRNYKAIKLQNGITALLTQDAQSKHFAAAVSVNAGASSDPRSLPGLAHFTEHMCFLGSKRYPEENEYKHYLAQHGGKSNASTSMSHTTYQFDILAEFGEHALDIFSNFFVAPLFTRSGTAREVQAVDSENSKNLVSDGRRRLQVLKALADKDHHYSKFSTGNRITLPACAEDEGEKKDDDNDTKKEEGGGSDDDHPLKDLVCSIDGNCDDADMAEFVRIALLAFHRQHYRPDNMTVVVVGPQTVDELEKWVVPRFGMIADRSANDGDNDEDDEKDDVYDDSITPEKKEKWQKMEQLAAQMIADAATDAPPVPIEAAKNVVHHSAFRAELQGGKWPVVVTTKPLQNVRKLVILFPMPPSYAEPERSPSHLMSHLFGHEGKGSPFALYQNAGWITSLSSGPRISAPDQNLFQITISLTKEGEEHWKDVVKYIFAYAKMLCTSAEETLKLSEGGACQSGDGTGKDDLYRIWEEVGKLDRMQFHQTSPGHVYSFAQSASQSISKYGTTNCLSVGSLLNETKDSLPLSGLLDFCQQIVPSNCFIERCSEGAWEEMEALYGDGTTSNSTSGFAFGKQVEKWYGVEYFVSPLDESDVKLWGEGIGAKEMESIHLPQPNRYIPRSLDLCEDLPEEARVQRIELPVSPPNLIVNEPSGRLWWKLDERYALPKAYLTVLIRTRASENILQSDESDQSQYNTKTSLQSEFLKSIFADALAIETYDAYLAGLGWSLSKSSAGFTLTCHGYSDRLPDLALKLLKELTSPSFLEERHFETAKDKTIRGLSSFFESRRADSLAIYYRNLLLNYKGNGVEENLEIARAITLRDIEKHHAMIWADNDLSLEVLYTGNVSEKQARSFFSDATDVIDSTRALVTQKEAVEDNIADSWASGPLERRLPAGEDIELHFESKNPKEENGAVVVTYQSQHEGFKGKSLSSKETLERSACVRLISKIIREPCFNELRTKQQLGYIVSSFYDMSYSTNETPLTTSIDSLTVYVLSRKVEPKDVAARIDDFLLNFRSKLEDMPSKEIQDYAESLAKELTKPIRKLGTEASNQFGKIRRYAPETLYADNDSSLEDIPFDNAEVVAAALHKLDRNMILDVYDSLIMKKGSRSRILTHVYGRTFPLKEVPPPAPSKVYVSSMNELMTKRKSLIAYEPHSNYQRTGTRLLGLVGRHRSLQYAAAAATVVGVVVLFKGRNDDKKQTKI